MQGRIEYRKRETRRKGCEDSVRDEKKKKWRKIKRKTKRHRKEKEERGTRAA